jgi:putative endonuclease
MGVGGAVYILVNTNHSVFYVGVTADLYSRIAEHREKLFPYSFTSKYNISKLVYYETFNSVEEAIALEKQIKKFSRVKKVELIVGMNPQWNDLYDVIRYW